MKLLTLAFVVGLASSCSAQTIAPPSSDTRVVKVQTKATSSSLEQSILEHLNQFRAANGARPLVIDPTLSKAAIGHSQSMAAGRVGLGILGTDLQKAACGVTSSADMVACYGNHGADPATKFVAFWTADTNRQNLVKSASAKCGLGVAKSANGLTYATILLTGTSSPNPLDMRLVPTLR